MHGVYRKTNTLPSQEDQIVEVIVKKVVDSKTFLPKFNTFIMLLKLVLITTTLRLTCGDYTGQFYIYNIFVIRKIITKNFYNVVESHRCMFIK